MRVIWKFPLAPGAPSRQMVSMPVYARLLSVGLDPQGELCVWAEVDPEEKRRQHVFFTVLGTGHPFPPEPMGPFIGTVSMAPLIFHVYGEAMG